MTRHFILLGLGLLPILAACTPVAPGPPARQATTPGECARVGGRWEYAGGMRREARMCVFYYPDAGRSCTDHSQCRGGCYLENAPLPANGEPVTGQCARDNRPAGHCRAAVEQGRAGGAICTD